jgi:hypothetical protein
VLINYRNEVWKDLKRPVWRPNEHFKISNYGRVLRLKYDPEGELMKLSKVGGYKMFTVKKLNGKSEIVYVHRAVAELFLENPLEKPFVIHHDYDKENNHVKNLAYATQKELSEHHLGNPKVIASKMEALKKPKYSKLNAGRVRLIKRKIFDPNRKTRMRLIAKQFGISEMQLYRIKSGENWGHIDY